MSQQPFFHGASGNTFENARQLRSNMTSAEKELWKHIRKDQFGGFRFRRQHPVANYILDFYCHDSRLAIELDGPIQDSQDQKKYDQERDSVIHSLGIEVLRFKNEEVFRNLNNVLAKIRKHLLKSSPEGEDLGGVNLGGMNS